MDACDAMLSAACGLNEQIAQQVFEALPEGGLVLAIMDGSGNCWSSDPEAFARLDLDEVLLGELRARVDDGADPVRVRAGEVMVTVAQLATEHTNCGYLFVVEPPRGGAAAGSHLDLVESLFGQITLAARLIEQHSRMREAPMRRYSEHATGQASAN